ncbi:MAG: DUF2490 domain-containing protein [Bacteroidales bacterium]|jgi:hypothetical protein|nr:DUF2490 domain-containing protein [Bacteroidales bacterium]
MKLTPSTALRASKVKGKVFGFSVLFFFIPIVTSSAQSPKETDAGAVFSFELEKGYSRFFSLSVEEEVRLITNGTGFDRSATSLGTDCALLNGRLKTGVYYAFLYTYNNDKQYEMRHRAYVNVLYRETFGAFTLSWRGRMQGTYRDKNRKAYRINPKYVLKNRFQVGYAIWGSPWTPFLSCELSHDLNDPESNAPTRIRYQGGVSRRLNRTNRLDFFIRFDRHTSKKDPDGIFAGVEYKIKLN